MPQGTPGLLWVRVLAVLQPHGLLALLHCAPGCLLGCILRTVPWFLFPK